MKSKIRYSNTINLCLALLLGAGLFGSAANAAPTNIRFDVIGVETSGAFVPLPSDYYGPWNSPTGTLQIRVPQGVAIQSGQFSNTGNPEQWGPETFDLGAWAPNLTGQGQGGKIVTEACWYAPEGDTTGRQPHAFRGDDEDCGGSWMGNAIASMNSTDGWSTSMGIMLVTQNPDNGSCLLERDAEGMECPNTIGPVADETYLKESRKSEGEDYSALDHVGLIEVGYNAQTGTYSQLENEVPVDIEVRTFGNRLIILPKVTLDPDSSYVVWATNGLLDSNQNNIVASEDFNTLKANDTNCETPTAPPANPPCAEGVSGACDAPDLYGPADTGHPSLCSMTQSAIDIAQGVLGDVGTDTEKQIIYAAPFTTVSTAQSVQALRNAAVVVTKPVFDCYTDGPCKSKLVGQSESLTATGADVWGAWDTNDPDYPEKNPSNVSYQVGMDAWYENLYAMEVVEKKPLGCVYPQPMWESGEPSFTIGRDGAIEQKSGVQKCVVRGTTEAAGMSAAASVEQALPELQAWGASEPAMKSFDWNNYIATLRPWGDMKRYHGTINLPIFIDSTYDIQDRYPGGPMSGWKFNQYRSASDSTWAIHKNWGSVQGEVEAAGVSKGTITDCFQNGLNCGMQTPSNPNGVPFDDIVKLANIPPLTANGELIDEHRYVTRFAPLPAVSSVRQIHFTLLMPKGAQVRRYVRRHGGVPVVIYQHGVTIFKATIWMAAPSIMRLMRNRHGTPTAVIAISQPLHSDRRLSKNINEVIMGEGGQTNVYINIEVPAVVAGNYTQSQHDTMGVVLGMKLAKVTKPGSYLDDLDGDRVFTIGHSLGALTNFSMTATANQVYGTEMSAHLPYKCSGVNCRKKTPFNPVGTTADVYADPGQGIASFMMVAPTMAQRINALLYPATKLYQQWKQAGLDAGTLPPNTCDRWDDEQNKSVNCVTVFKETHPVFTTAYGTSFNYAVQTKVDMVDPNNSTKIMNPDHPFIQVNATYEGTIPSYVYDNPTAGGGPLSDDPRWGTDHNDKTRLRKSKRAGAEGLEILHETIKCREYALRGSKRCEPLQLVGWYGGTDVISSTLLGAFKTRGDFAYHITLLGVPYRMHMEMMKNATSFWASDGTEVHVSKGRYLESTTPPVCYQTHNGMDVSFNGIPLTVDQMGNCPRGTAYTGGPGYAKPAAPKKPYPSD